MALSLTSGVIRAEGLQHRVAIRIAGLRDDLRAVRVVDYDLGPTFDERHRRSEQGEDGFAIEVAAYGEFMAVARVTLEDGRTEVLTHLCGLPGLGAHSLSADTIAATLEAAPREASATARAVMLGQILLGTGAFVLGALLVVAWFGPVAVHIPLGWLGRTAPAGWPLDLSPDVRFLLLAAAAGGLGALVQAASTLPGYLQHRFLYPSWIGWYMLRAPTGMALGAIGYGLLRAGLLPDVDPVAISPLGVTVVSFVIGFGTPRLTTALQALARASWESAAPEVIASRADADRSTVAPASDVALAEAALRGEDISAREMYELAERLRKVNEFGLARRLYGRIRRNRAWTGVSVTAVRVGQRHALATYKDPDLPAADRFTRALEILDEVDDLDVWAPPASSGAERSERLAIEQRQESLGLRGAIHKRRWQVDGQRVDLERALGYYLRGHEIGRTFGGTALGVETDQGYNGINAAFVLDLLAREEARQARYAGTTSAMARRRALEARDIRRSLIDTLPRLLDRPDYGWLRTQWWFHATLAEAYVGLGRFEEAIAALGAYNTVHGLPPGPPIEHAPSSRSHTIASWEFESTFTQLASLVWLQAELADLIGGDLDDGVRLAPDETPLIDRGRRALRAYLGKDAPALDRAEVGKLGLALSGGGFRASLYHIGVLACLAERDVLRRVEVLSCVSGGSIVGAHVYLHLKRLLEATGDDAITREDYVRIVEDVAREFVAGVQTNIRAQVFGSIWANLRALFQPGYTTTRRLGALYERELYARVQDGHRGPRVLGDLFVHPKGESGFKPKHDNWRRRTKVPMLVLNATTLNTGHNWQFTASWMGEPPIRLGVEIEGNYRLRRMYYREAPRLANRWRRWYTRPFAPPDFQRIRLGEAVAASSCVPGLFEPLVLPDLFERKTVRLVDGGVHDNQGIASLLEQDCSVMIVSDASGQMEAQDDPPPGRLGVTLRAFNVSMTRVREAQFRELAARERSGLLRGLMFLHLTRDLDADPVDWRDCQDPYDASDEARPASRRGVMTGYGLHKTVQHLLAGIRTDLDSFTDLEASALMASGYRQADAQLARLPALAGAAPDTRHAWPFLAVEPLLVPGHPSFEEVTRVLKAGARVGLKVWVLSPVLKALGIGLLAAAAFGVFRLWQIYYDAPLVTVGVLGTTVALLLVSTLAPRVIAALRYRQTVRSLGIKSALAAVLAVGFKIHLLLFDPIFLRLGRLPRFAQPDPPPVAPED